MKILIKLHVLIHPVIPQCARVDKNELKAMLYYGIAFFLSFSEYYIIGLFGLVRHDFYFFIFNFVVKVE